MSVSTIISLVCCILFFFFQAEDGIRDIGVTGVQTCALPICAGVVTEVGKNVIHLTPGDRVMGLVPGAFGPIAVADQRTRSEERRVGKECRSRWSPYH